jgi:hypothetical protein
MYRILMTRIIWLLEIKEYVPINFLFLSWFNYNYWYGCAGGDTTQQAGQCLYEERLQITVGEHTAIRLVN